MGLSFRFNVTDVFSREGLLRRTASEESVRRDVSIARSHPPCPAGLGDAPAFCFRDRTPAAGRVAGSRFREMSPPTGTLRHGGPTKHAGTPTSVRNRAWCGGAGGRWVGRATKQTRCAGVCTAGAPLVRTRRCRTHVTCNGSTGRTIMPGVRRAGCNCPRRDFLMHCGSRRR